jgi:hypothetical protein
MGATQIIVFESFLFSQFSELMSIEAGPDN